VSRSRWSSVVRYAILVTLASSTVYTAFSGNGPKYTMIDSVEYLNPELPFESRVADLVHRMTLEEKIQQLQYEAPAIERLHVPAYNWWNEALHGVARAGHATVFPQAIGLAATWDTELMLNVARVISTEARAKHHQAVREGRRGIYEGLTFWSPNINIFRDPRWGRGMETYGEDPYLTARLAVAFVRGLQGEDPKYLKTVATPKHFAVHSGPEPDRHSFDAIVDERDLRETYLPAFRASVLEAHAQSVMCAYNRFRGAPCCGSGELLERILRKEWKFDGYVVSDCGAIQDIYARHRVVPTEAEAAALALRAGTDLNCGTAYEGLREAVRQGLIDEQTIDRSVARLFRARFALGMFDPPERVPYAQIPFALNEAPEHGALAGEAARRSIVLLKNEGPVLPLAKGLSRIAVVGPNADDVEVLLGNYNGVPSRPITPLEGIRGSAGEETQVVFARGCDLAEGMPSIRVVPSAVLVHWEDGRDREGLHGEYFENRERMGPPFATRADRSVDFHWGDQAPLQGMKADTFSVRWTGFVVPPVTGIYALGVRMFGGVRLYLDDTLLVDIANRHDAQACWKSLELQAGRKYSIRLEFWDQRPEASVQLVWAPPEPELKREALSAAREADMVIAVLGLSPRLEGEEMNVPVEGFAGGDRVAIGLPAMQEEFLRDLVAVGTPVVLVLLNGSALAIPWAADHVPGIIELWYPGQSAGQALGEVLFGEYSPAGRLPVTFYRSVDQLPPFTDYAMQGRTYRYFTGDPLFAFGHGLSYTRFAYDRLVIPATAGTADTVRVSVDVTNVGDRAGDEVVQLYLSDLEATVVVPVRSLQGFQRIRLLPGERRTVEFVLTPRQFSLISDDGRRVVEPGEFSISVGGKQPGFTGHADAQTTEVRTGSLILRGPVRTIPEDEG
jgi:beta-glucosidase